MDLHQLQAFDQIVFHSSFSKAARKLGISQPTISSRIRALENGFVYFGKRLGIIALRNKAASMFNVIQHNGYTQGNSLCVHPLHSKNKALFMFKLQPSEEVSALQLFVHPQLKAQSPLMHF
jgi:hypothetical protein